MHKVFNLRHYILLQVYNLSCACMTCAFCALHFEYLFVKYLRNQDLNRWKNSCRYFYIIPRLAHNIKNSRRSNFYLDETKRVWIKSDCLFWIFSKSNEVRSSQLTAVIFVLLILVGGTNYNCSHYIDNCKSILITCLNWLCS